MKYYAHTKEGRPQEEWQLLKEHCSTVGKLVAEYSKKWCTEEYAENLGVLHDIGKYQKSFQKRLADSKIRIEHSICGAKECCNYNMERMGADYCISGHHTGLPDIGTSVDGFEEPTLQGRLKRKCEDYSSYKSELALNKIKNEPWINGIKYKKEYAFFIRMMYSCLVDADFIDTESFCSGIQQRGINADFEVCLNKIKTLMHAFPEDTPVNKARKSLLNQCLAHIDNDAELLYMNMPTGSGKTLTSMRFALEKAIKQGKKRIIYVIPFTSIIEQNSKVYKNCFGEDAVLEHHCNFDYYEHSQSSEDADRFARSAENWDASIIVTTNVQFFKSIYTNKSSGLRKLHNIADSIIVFDEAHMFPSNYYQPCLEAIKILIKNYDCTALFLTATMPDFNKWLDVLNCRGIKTKNLIEDISPYKAFERCNIKNAGRLSCEGIFNICDKYTSSLIVVNSKKAARYLYSKLSGEKYHLSTYMTKYDRERTLTAVKGALKEERKFVLISTSLIEAGVDLDFECVMRELAGLDNILQTAGRCNREGKEDKDDCTAYVFTFEEDDLAIRNSKSELLKKSYFTEDILKKYDNVNDISAVTEYFDRFYGYIKETLSAMDFNIAITKSGFNFASYAKEFNYIDENSIDIVINYPDIEEQQEIIKKLPYEGKSAKRKLQKYVVSLRSYDFNKLEEQGVLDIRNGMCFLTNFNYYNESIGIKFEDDTDYIL